MTFAEYDYDMDIAAQREEAMEIGIAIGEERAHKKALDTARNLLLFGMATEQIALATGLSIAEIENLASDKA